MLVDHIYQTRHLATQVDPPLALVMPVDSILETRPIPFHYLS